ncbi:glutaredoxin family protein [bacterium]|jgi:glutaredoxin|nr:glutaredoxin family protein [bacterium]|tara:strand:+ start:614 stop:889 length:276 start_codon:yes stop_codon:yes gene_type:complete
MKKKVILYSTKDCPYCVELKNSLNNAAIQYEMVDVDENEKQWDDLCETLNVEFVPTVIIADENNGTGNVFTPDVHFDEVSECFELIVEALR